MLRRLPSLRLLSSFPLSLPTEQRGKGDGTGVDWGKVVGKKSLCKVKQRTLNHDQINCRDSRYKHKKNKKMNKQKKRKKDKKVKA